MQELLSFKTFQTSIIIYITYHLRRLNAFNNP